MLAADRLLLHVALLLAIAGIGGVGAVPSALGQVDEGRTGPIEGRVVDADEGVPVPGANVLVQRDGRRVAGTSADAEGRFQVTTAAAGTYVLRVSAVGYQTTTREVTLEEGATASLTVRLTAQAYDLSEIVVRSTRVDASSSTTVQRVEAAAIQQQDAASVADVARLIPGTHVQTNSRGQTLLYFRDAGERQNAQFINGALFNVPWDNRVDISFIPASVLGGITVSKGVPSVRYGANVVGGAANLQVRTLERPGQRTELRGALGWPEAGQGTVTHLGRTGDVSYTAALSYQSRTDEPLPAGADLPYSQPGDRLRVNTDRRAVSGFGQMRYALDGGGEVGVALLHLDGAKGVAPESNVNPQTTSVRYWRYPTWRKSMAIVNGSVPLGPQVQLRGAAWGSRFAQTIDQYRSVAYQALQQRQADTDWTGGARLLGLWQGAGPGTLALAVNALTTRHRQVNTPFDRQNEAGADSVSVYRQHIGSVGAEYEVGVTDRLQATAGLSANGSAIVDTGPWAAVDPQLAQVTTTALDATLGLSYVVSDAVTLRASGGRKSRFPTMRELFGGALGKFVPNPDLQPVQAWLLDVGADVRTGRVSGGVSLFLNRTFGTIDKRTFQSGPNEGQEQRINLDGSRIYGVEVTGAARPVDRLTLDGHLTWMQPRAFQDGDVRKLDEKPAWLGTLTATYDLPLGLAATVQAEYTDGAFARNEQNAFVPLPSAFVLDGRVSYRFAGPSGALTTEVYARVNNATDALRLLQLGLPGPGRSFQMGAKIAF